MITIQSSFSFSRNPYSTGSASELSFFMETKDIWCVLKNSWSNVVSGLRLLISSTHIHRSFSASTDLSRHREIDLIAGRNMLLCKARVRCSVRIDVLIGQYRRPRRINNHHFSSYRRRWESVVLNIKPSIVRTTINVAH